MRKTHRKDANHAQIRQAAERMGFYFWDASQSSLGVDAFLVKAGRLVPVEVKDGSKPPSAQQLTKHEQRVHIDLMQHGVRVILLTCIEDLCQLERAHPMRSEG